MTSITGMKTGNFTDINNQGEIRLGNALDAGTPGQVLLSNGINNSTYWGANSAVVPNALTMGTSLSLTSGNPSWDGGVADTINATVPIYTGGNGIDITGVNITTDNDGTTINNTGGTGAQNQVLKVPNDLTINGTIFNGSVARTFTLSTTDTTYQGGANITIDTTTAPDTINLDTALTNVNLTDSTNIIHPPNVFDVAGDLRMSIEMGNFYPNDDSSYYNIGVEDDGVAATNGTIRVLTSGLEVCGYFIIPNNYTATAVRIDINDTYGIAVSRTIMCQSITTYGGTGYTSLNFSGTSGAEFSLLPTMAGASDKIMLIKIYTTATTDHIRGGYILLTR